MPLTPRMRRRERRALGRWSPVQKGPLPPLVRRMFMRQAEQQASRWAAPRQRAITDYTGALQQQLAPIAGRIGGYYGQAQQGQAGSDAALSAMLSGQGQQIAGDLQAQLAAAGQETGGLQAGQIGQGSAGAAYAMGAANLGRLLAQGAAAQGSAAQLPGIAGLGGLQHTRELQGMAQQQTQQGYQSLLDRELEKWISRTGLGMERAQLGESRRQFNVSAAQRAAENAAPTKAEEAKMMKRRWATVRESLKDADDLARTLRGRNVAYGVAYRRVRQLLKRRSGWMSDKRLNAYVRRILVDNGIHKPGSPGAGGPIGEPGPKTPGDPGGGTPF